ncbi:SDR family oxidoreductase [Propioniciclava soli]|uniref:SDR family oxidoreductase n=1 Tax=Propioniciclava soli TaxID=2775081 RepID=A0ABZ3C9S5_9ACTN
MTPTTSPRTLPADAPRVISTAGADPIAGRFAGRSILVTGAASGIGLATTQRLLAEGARVIAADRTADALAELAAAPDPECLVTVTCDVTSEDDVQAAVRACEGRLDGLVNNAGIMDGFEPIAEVTDAAFARVMDINVGGTVRMTRAAMPLLLDGGGSIVNLGSMAALGGAAGGAAYTASKHAVIGLTRSTAVMYAADDVRCNAIAPGAVITASEKNVASARGAQVIGPLMGARMPSLASAESLAACICFLLSDDAAFVTGATLAADGSWSAQ